MLNTHIGAAEKYIWYVSHLYSIQAVQPQTQKLQI